MSHDGISADRRDKEWYVCNDEMVEKRSDPPRKKIKLVPDCADVDASRDAYMLVYKRRMCMTPCSPPISAMAAVQADNSAFAAELDDRARK